jgi:flavodoxin
MKTLIAYYSRTGNNERLARQLHQQVPSDLDQIVDTKKRDSMPGSAFAAWLKLRTKIAFSKDPGAYDQVIIVTPFWAGNLPPATRTYLGQQRANLKKFAILSACGLGEENPHALADVTATAGKAPFAALLIKESTLGDDITKEKFEAFVGQLPAPVLA